METNITKEKSSTFDAVLNSDIKDRRSIRAFARKLVEDEKIKSLFEAARWAPSSANEQPWFYIYAMQEQALWDSLFDVLDEGNKIWVAHAPLLMVSLARKTFDKNGKENFYAFHDLGAANAFMSLQAVSLGLQIHQMGGFNHEALRNSIRIPENFHVGSMIAAGYPGELNALPEHLQQREVAARERFKQEEFVKNTSF